MMLLNRYFYFLKKYLSMKKIVTLFVWVIVLASQSKAQSAPNVQLINPTTVATPRGYSHAAIVDLGNCKMVILSGQVALDPKDVLVGANDIGKTNRTGFPKH
jgi:2-iminobutanoate/2-iminopropanoate deaminase